MNGDSGDSTTLPNLAALLPPGPPPDPNPQLVIDRLLPPTFPALGEALGGYVLLLEIGRGAVGRVFLASEQGVAGRPVVLKVTPCSDAEYLSLGRLQHTHIIPLHAVRDFPDRHLRALCQPYFGSGASLAASWPPCAEDARPPAHFGQRLDGVRLPDRSSLPEPPLPMPESGGPRSRLRRMAYVDAVCWIGSCLAEALHHAHERGLVHLDIKPSNILLAADGQPLLLDFHLAHAALSAGQKVPLTLGGTPGYMSPEQRAAYDTPSTALGPNVAARPRSDVRSLLAGHGCCTSRLGGNEKEAIDAVPLRRRNPNVRPGTRGHSPPLPGDRAGRSLSEWGRAGRRSASPPSRPAAARRREPQSRRALEQMASAPAVRALVGRTDPVAWSRCRAFFVAGVLQGAASAKARESLHSGWDLYQARHYAEAAHSFKHGADRVAHLPGCTDLRDHLDLALVQAGRAAAAARLHGVADRLRVMIGTDITTRKELEELDAQVRAVRDGQHRFWPRNRCSTPIPKSRFASTWPTSPVSAAIWPSVSTRTPRPNRHGDRRIDRPRLAPEHRRWPRTDPWWKHANEGRTLMRSSTAEVRSRPAPGVRQGRARRAAGFLGQLLQRRVCVPDWPLGCCGERVHGGDRFGPGVARGSLQPGAGPRGRRQHETLADGD